MDAEAIGFTMTKKPVISTTEGGIQNHTGMWNILLAPISDMNWLTAPNMSKAPRTCISDVTNLSGNNVSISPNSMLPIPTIGNGGLLDMMSLPWAS